MARQRTRGVACTLGIVPHLIAAVTGLPALLHTGARGFEIMECARRRLPALHGLAVAARERRAEGRGRRRPALCARALSSTAFW